ncbi:transposase [Cumulibacter soli]|uniref:transposase n=1 Tax=Cumulibacter soli TaxID=2546344 RepID=UPI003C7CB567
MISDEAWAAIGPLFPKMKSTGRPPVDRRTVVEATAWRFRTGAPWRVDDEEPPGLRREGPRPRVYPHARAGRGHQHADRDVE